MAHKHDLHVMPDGDGWKIVRPHEPEPVGVAGTQEDAAHIATQMQYDSAEGGEVIIHGRDGTIRERTTINRDDPFPPPG